MTALYAIQALRKDLDSLQRKRHWIQTHRVTSDDAIFPLFRDPIQPFVPDVEYVATHDAIVYTFHIPETIKARPRVPVVTGDVISDKVTGPATRALEMSKTLSRDCAVRLVSTTAASRSVDGLHFSVHTASGPGLEPYVDWADVLVSQGYLLWEAPWIVERDIVTVADIYDPFHLEQLEQARDLGEQGRRATVASVTADLNQQLDRADLLLSAPEKQRQFWLGQLESRGR